MSEKWLTIIAGAVGVAGTLAAWFFNPHRRYLQELDRIVSDLAVLYDKRDKALDESDTDSLTRVTFDIARMQSRRDEILQRLGPGVRG